VRLATDEQHGAVACFVVVGGIVPIRRIRAADPRARPVSGSGWQEPLRLGRTTRILDSVRLLASVPDPNKILASVSAAAITRRRRACLGSPAPIVLPDTHEAVGYEGEPRS
jgi:hypothetical protein